MPQFDDIGLKYVHVATDTYYRPMKGKRNAAV